MIIRHAHTNEVLYQGDIHSGELVNANLRFAWLPAEDLSYIDLSGANLEFANLCNANLLGAKLIRTNCRRAMLGNANLHRADLTGCDLTGAGLEGANLDCAELTNCKFKCTSVTSATKWPASFTLPDDGLVYPELVFAAMRAIRDNRRNK